LNGAETHTYLPQHLAWAFHYHYYLPFYFLATLKKAKSGLTKAIIKANAPLAKPKNKLNQP
jgi:hypothetical protein